MALSPTAPWIVPPDYTGAMARGAQAGMAARAQDREEQSAADRLKLAYTQLDAHERRAAEAASARRDQQMAAMALRAQQQQGLAQLHADMLKRQQAQDAARQEQATAAMALREKQISGLDTHRAVMEDIAQQKIDKPKAGETDKLYHVGTKLVDADGNVVFDAAEGALTDVDKMRLHSALTTKRTAQAKLADPYSSQGGAAASLSNTVFSADQELKDILQRYSPKGVTNTPAAAALAPTNTLASAKSPFPEGTRIKSKKTGKTFVIRNGEPVPEDQTQSTPWGGSDEELP